MAPPGDIRRSFDEVVEVYDQVRPTYPRALFDALFSMLPPEPEIVEVGPGTGQATRDLLDRGAFVHAVEIGPAMAAALRSKFGSERLRVTVGDFEEVDLPPRSADAMFSATAYHWITPQAQSDRPAAILRPGGVLAVVDLIQVDSADDAGFFDAAQPIYERYGQPHVGPPTPARESVDPAIREVLEGDRRFGPVAVRRYDWNQTYTASDYRLLMRSYSGTQMMDENDRRGLLDDIEALVRSDFGGAVTRPLVVTLTTAAVLEPAAEIRRLDRDELSLVGQIDRGERIDMLYEQQGTELVARHGTWNASAWYPEGTGEHSVAAQVVTVERYVDAGGVAVGAFAEGRLVGIGVVVVHVRPTVAQLAFLHVSAPFRATGIGGRLAAHLEDIARTAGDSEMVVSATPSENTVRFYLGRGFQPIAEPLSELLELEPEDVHMLKPL